MEKTTSHNKTGAPAKSTSKILWGISQSLEKGLRIEIKGKEISVKEITDLID